MSLLIPKKIWNCVCVKSSTHRWLSFIEGNHYAVHNIHYSDQTVDQTHNAVQGTFRDKQGNLEDRKLCMSKEDCKEYLKII